LSGALLGLCAAVILLACFNLGGVMLARGQVRRAEFAVCAALGAGRARLTRQLLIEAVLVGLAAAAFALLLAWVGRNLLNALSLPLPVPLDLSLAIDGYVVAALVTTTLGVAMLFGLWPALQLSAAVRGTTPSLREGSESRAPRQRGRRVLIAVQAALTVCLLLFAALVLRAVQQSATVDTGFSVREREHGRFRSRTARDRLRRWSGGAWKDWQSACAHARNRSSGLCLARAAHDEQHVVRKCPPAGPAGTRATTCWSTP
jgi:hypothetical protein